MSTHVRTLTRPSTYTHTSVQRHVTGPSTRTLTHTLGSMHVHHHLHVHSSPDVRSPRSVPVTGLSKNDRMMIERNKTAGVTITSNTSVVRLKCAYLSNYRCNGEIELKSNAFDFFSQCGNVLSTRNAIFFRRICGYHCRFFFGSATVAEMTV